MVVWYGDDAAGPLVDGELEIFAQRLSASGAQLGADDRRVSDMGPNGEHGLRGARPRDRLQLHQRRVPRRLDRGRRLRAARRQRARDLRPAADARPAPRWAPTTGGSPTWGRPAPRASPPSSRPSPTTRSANQYVVAWVGDDDTAPLVDNEDEIFVQRLGANGAEEGPNDRRVSDAGPDGNTSFGANFPNLAYNPASDEYLVAWEGDDDTAGPRRGRDLRPAPGRERRRGGHRRPADLADGPRRRQRLPGQHPPRRRRPRWAASTWSPSTARTTPRAC